jgi:hypothetical protein
LLLPAGGGAGTLVDGIFGWPPGLFSAPLAPVPPLFIDPVAPEPVLFIEPDDPAPVLFIDPVEPMPLGDAPLVPGDGLVVPVPMPELPVV